MASMKDRLTADLGDRMRASMGVGEPAATPDGPRGTAPAAAGKYDGVKALREARLIPIDKLTPDPDQPRKMFSDEAIDRLADSLRARGMLQPIRARWDADLGRWVIVAGERRFRAARRAGWAEVPCVTTEAAMTETEILQDQLIENCLREDLAPLEQAQAFKSLMEANGWSARRLGEELHLSHQTIIRALAILDLPESVKARVESGEIAPRTAAEIATLDDPDAQRAVAERVVAEGLSRSETIEAVKQAASSRTARTKGRGAAKGRPRKRTEWAVKGDGYRVIVECRRGIDPAGLLAALERALANARAEFPADADAGQGGPLAA